MLGLDKFYIKVNFLLNLSSQKIISLQVKKLNQETN
jgi:hypothetical protein